jgi:hypothetical protein
VWIERFPRRAVRVVASSAAPDASRTIPYEIVDSREPFARGTGWLRPSVTVSRGLLDTVRSPQLEVLIAHAQAEALRRDPLRVRCAALALAPLAKLSAAMLQELRTANQQDCDAFATRTCGASAVVATLNALAAETQTGRRLQSIAERILAIALPPSWTLPAIVVPLAVLGVYAAVAVPGIAAARELAVLFSSWLA